MLQQVSNQDEISDRFVTAEPTSITEENPAVVLSFPGIEQVQCHATTGLPCTCAPHKKHLMPQCYLWANGGKYVHEQ